MQDEDEEDELVAIGRRLALELRPLHRHAFEVELVVGEVAGLPGWRESDRLSGVIATFYWEEKKPLKSRNLRVRVTVTDASPIASSRSRKPKP